MSHVPTERRRNDTVLSPHQKQRVLTASASSPGATNSIDIPASAS